MNILVTISTKNSGYLYNIPERYYNDIINRALELYINSETKEEDNQIVEKIQEVIEKIDNIQIPEAVYIQEPVVQEVATTQEPEINVMRDEPVIDNPDYDDVDMDLFFG